MSKETVVTCPKCNSAVHTATLSSDYIVLTCQRCHTALQFVVDLQPSFDRTESACAAIR